VKKYFIYCVDDDPFITGILGYQLSKELESLNFIIDTINDPTLLLEKINLDINEGNIPCLSIIDFQMPEINGDKLTRYVKQSFPEMKILMLSGNSNALLVSELVDDGLINYYINKPWEKDDLLQKINDCLPLNLKFL
jgi:CheY-like chemotaxis protein